MKRSSFLMILLLAGVFVLHLTPPGVADVAPGDVIDHTNWEKVQTLVPESVVTWVKEGRIVLDIGEVSYAPGDQLPDFVLQSRKANTGKYDLDDEHWIVEEETGERTEYIVGIPFPEVDPADPKAGG